MDIDRYGRTIGMVMIDSVNVNEALLKAGLEWHYKKYDKNPLWITIETKAKNEKKLLLVMANPVEIGNGENRIESIDSVI